MINIEFDRKGFFIGKLNGAVSNVLGMNPRSETYLMWEDEIHFHWTRNWGETVYDLAESVGGVDWEDVDVENPLEVMGIVDNCIRSIEWESDDELEEWFFDALQNVCGVVKVYGYHINKAEALKRCDQYAWRELFLDWLEQGVKDVSAYEDMGE